jgi:LDH2 family malate/lactate/ureidoglycolate dehydrogenase
VTVVTREALARFTTGVFVRAGLPDADARTVAEVLVWADLRGVDSHGVMRVPMYVRLLDAGDLNPKPAITTRTETAAAIVLEMDRAAGPVAMARAAGAAVRKAREAGIGVALARATTHTAALGYYTSAIAREGMAAVAFAASVPMMAYHGARIPGVSTSPISIAVPATREPLTFDMATSVVSMGRLTQARRAGQPIPAGLAIDEEGMPTTDPVRAAVPLPVGGPKGSGLSLMIECLTSLLLANPIIAEALGGTADGRRHRQNGLVLAIDLARFGDPTVFRAEVERLIRTIKALPRDPAVEEILVPGERGDRTFEERSRDGIPLWRRRSPSSIGSRSASAYDRSQARFTTSFALPLMSCRISGSVMP